MRDLLICRQEIVVSLRGRRRTRSPSRVRRRGSRGDGVVSNRTRSSRPVRAPTRRSPAGRRADLPTRRRTPGRRGASASSEAEDPSRRRRYGGSPRAHADGWSSAPTGHRSPGRSGLRPAGAKSAISGRWSLSRPSNPSGWLDDHPPMGGHAGRSATSHRPIRLGRCGDLSVSHGCATLPRTSRISPGGACFATDDALDQFRDQ